MPDDIYGISPILKKEPRDTNNKDIPIKDFSEAQLTRFDILSADEVFLVGTNIEIRIISQIDNIKFNSVIVKKIISHFDNFVRS